MSRYGLIMRMESADAQELANNPDEMMAATAEANDAVQEVGSATGAVDEVATGIEQATQASEELGEIQGSLEEAVESGEGISEREAEHVQARLEHVAYLLGTTVADMGLTFRRESFGGKSSRLSATKMRLEGIKEWAKNIWEAIKRAWRWLSDAVKAVFTKFTGSAERLEKRLKGLQERLTAIKNKTTENKNSNIKTGAKFFSLNGEVGKQQIVDVIKLVAIYDKICHDVAAQASNDTTASFSLKNGDKFAVLPANAIAVIFKQAGEGTYAGDKSTYEKISKKAEFLIRLPNQQGIVSIPKEVTVSGKILESFTFEEGKIEDKNKESYGALTAEDMTTILNEATTEVKKLKSFQKTETEFKGLIDNNIKWADKQISLSQSLDEKKSENDDAKEAAKDNYATAREANTIVVAAVKICTSKLVKASFDILNEAANVIDSNLGNMKIKKDD